MSLTTNPLTQSHAHNNHNSHNPSRSKPTLSTLHPELRLQIWSHFHPLPTASTSQSLATHVDLYNSTYLPHHRAFKALAQTCRVLREDALALWYAHRTLTFKSVPDMYARLREIGPVARKYVGRVRMHLVESRAGWEGVGVEFGGEGGAESGREMTRLAFGMLAESISLHALWVSVDGDAVREGQVWHGSLLEAWRGRGMEMVRGRRGLDFRVRFAQISDGFEGDDGTVFRSGWLMTRGSETVLKSAVEFEAVMACLMSDEDEWEDEENWK